MHSFDPAAKVLMIGLEGQSLTPQETAFLKAVRPAGVILFGRNIDQSNHDQVRRLTTSIQKNGNPSGDHHLDAAPPSLIAIDQEGGRVTRLKGEFPNLGPALELAERRTDQAGLDLIQAYGESMGNQLCKLGINVNFAPVIDLHTEPKNTAIGDRCFGETPDQVVLRAGAFLAGLQKSGVMGCLKHFPGQGHAAIDTHLGTAVVDVSEDLLWERELAPFRRLIHKDHNGIADFVPMVMVAHCIYPALSSIEASRSPEVMDQLLRKKLGYTGVIVTDDMLMGAIPQSDGAWCQAILDSIRAGADLVLVCKGLDKAQLAYSCIGEEAERDPVFAVRLNDAAQRVTELRNRAFHPKPTA